MKHIVRASVAALPFLLLQACVAESDDDVLAAEDELVYLDACEPGEVRFCDQNEDPTVDGEQLCVEEDGETGWTVCAPRVMEGAEDCYEDEIWDGERCSVGASTVSTPIVLSFDGAPVRYASGTGDFDLTGRAFNVTTDWPTAATPWLALDRDGNGRIDDGGELFGSATRLASGALARHGFEALAELDHDSDGRLDAADPAFTALVTWRDHDSDRRTGPGELLSLAEAGITSISLSVSVSPRCDRAGNCERERATFSYRDASGELREGDAIDVHLAWH